MEHFHKKGTGNSKLFLGPILRYIFASQKHSGRTVLLSISMSISISCYAFQLSTIGQPAQATVSLMCINGDKIKSHEEHVAHAQKRYRLIKPALTLCGASLVLSYFWYTSSTLSSKEVDKIRQHMNLVEQKKQETATSSWFDWSKSNVSSVGGVAVELIGGALIIPPLSELIGTLTGSAYIMSSLEVYDKEYTHCHALLTQIARDMQMNLASQAAGKPMAIGISEVVNASNRLVNRLEKLLGFMRVTLRKFPKRSLRLEAQAIEKRLFCYTKELCKDMQHLIEKSLLDSAAVLELIVQFAQQYAQEIQRFSFLEQDALDVV